MGRSGTKPRRDGVKRRGKNVIKERRGMKEQSNTGEGKKGGWLSDSSFEKGLLYKGTNQLEVSNEWEAQVKEKNMWCLLLETKKD